MAKGGLPGGSAVKPAEYVKAMGTGFGAKVPGMDDLVPLDHPSMAVHLGTDTQFDPGGDDPMVGLHDAYHGGALPPELMKLLSDAIAVVQEMRGVHGFAGSPLAMPGADDGGAPMGVPGGLPGGSAMAA